MVKVAASQNLANDRSMTRSSGIDSGTKFYMDVSTPNRLVFNTAFHHITEHGMYDDWTSHQVIVTPDLADEINLQVTGRDRNEIKDYLADCFLTALTREVDLADVLEKG